MANEPVDAKSADAGVPAVRGENTVQGGSGVVGIAPGGTAPPPFFPGAGAAVLGSAGFNGTGVYGEARGPAIGVFGNCKDALPDVGIGVFGQGDSGTGVQGTGNKAGVSGFTTVGIGVHGQCTGGNDGVLGESDTGLGVHGTSRTNHAVHGESVAGRGVVGISQTFVGVTGISTGNDGVLGISTSGIGVHGKGGQLAGLFEGDISVTGKITVQGDIVLANADCAEDFDISGPDAVEPGTVMVLGSEGSLSASHRAYDKRVAGVISGAGSYKPGIVLDQRQTKSNRQPIALLGKVFCKVDAQFGAIEIGDLLTTSPTPGHAMKTSNPFEAFGAVIGKALKPLSSGQGLIPILISLQ